MNDTALSATASPAPTTYAGPPPWRAALAAGLGTAIEYYDFQLYAVMAVTLSPLFFANHDPTAGLLLTLGIFAGAFVVRPIGGVFFGWLGDKHGRTAALLVTILGMGCATALMGALPTYATAGILAPLMLLVLRLMQGFFAGGEVTGAATYIAECSPTNRRGFFGALNPAAATLGLTVATAVAAITATAFGTDNMASWAWRVPFLISVPLILLCYWARTTIEDSPKFKEIARQHKLPKAPLREIIRNHRPGLLKVIAIGFAQNATGYVCLVYLNIHLTNTLGYDKISVFWLISAVSFLAVLLKPLFGAVSDRVGRKPMLVLGFAGYMVIAPATMYVASLGSFTLVIIAVTISILPFSVVQAVGYPLYAELFPTRVRYSGVSLGFNIATIVGAGTASYIAAWLTAVTGNPMAPAGYVVIAALIGLLTVTTVSETAARPLTD
ncbi:MAG TPA: MFS transporter [Steroidobacteraceae bacterium]|nr:MFS transporter [Steroidobacteraceae bacterium]